MKLKNIKLIHIINEAEKKRLLKEAYFKLGDAEKVINTMVMAIEKKIGQKLYGSPTIVDKIQKSDGIILGVKYNVGDGKKAIRFNVSPSDMSNVVSIDFWYNFDRKPTYELETAGLFLMQIIEVCAETIMSGGKTHIVEETQDQIIGEGANDSTGQIDIKSLLAVLKEKRNNIYDWLAANGEKDSKILTAIMSQDWNYLFFNSYEPWARSKETKVFSYGGFRTNVIDAKRRAGLVNVKKINLNLSGDEDVLADDETSKNIFDEAREYNLTPEEVFHQMELYVKSVASGHDMSLILCGDPGIGKTFGVKKCLIDSGFTEITTDDPGVDDFQDEDSADIRELGETQYLFISGKITAASMYKIFVQYNGALVVFDDCDSVFGNSDGINLLKAATDDKKVRRISMITAQTQSKKSTVPPSFDYTGRVIFITNKYLREIDEAIKSRALVCEIDLTSEQIIERIKAVMKKIMPDVQMEIKKEVLDFLLEINHLYTKIDFRTFQQCVKERLRGSPNWKKLVGNQIIQKRGKVSLK